MDKIVGNILVTIFLLSTCWYIHAGITLRATDLRGSGIQEAVAGYPFKLVVAMDDASSGMKRPNLKGVDQWRITGRETKMQSINGKGSVQHIYTITIDKPGNYVLGPAQLDDESSNTISINVANASAAQAQAQSQARSSSRASKSQGQLFARLTADKTDVVVGEKICCTLSLFCNDDTIKLQEIGEPDLSKFTVAARKGHFDRGQQKVDGANYQCVEWQWELYPNQAGQMTIPAFSLDYAVVMQEDSVFRHFWGPRYVGRRVYSNPVSLNVNTLPPHDTPVKALGKFSSFTMKLNPVAAKEGEGMVLTLELKGDGNFHAIEAPQLTGLPASFKSYESKNYMTEDGSAPFKKSFEYIIQGMQAGEWEISEQQFTYYDVHSGTYKTLQTKPIMAKIIAQPTSAVSANMPLTIDQDIRADIEFDDQIKTIHKDGPWQEHKERYVPLWLLLIAMLVPVVLLALYYLKKKYARNRGEQAFNRKRAIAHARLALQAAQKRDAAGQLYPIFTQLFAARLASPLGEVNEEKIERLLTDAGLTDEQLALWRQFFSQIAALVFAHKREHLPNHDMFEQAYYWLQVLENRL